MSSKNNLKEKLFDMSKEEVIEMYLKEMKCKKYGLVWEDTPELLDSKDIYPLLKEQKELSLNKVTDKPMNYLIEGDNYHSLKALQKTHLGKIDVIYIDPPYNTGNEFIYNDKIVDKEDNFRHSKWLSFMEKRLKLAKNLLSEDGVIFVSIDDNEYAQLKLLMDNIFGEINFISTIIWEKKKNQGTDTKHISNIHEYILCFSRNIEKVKFKRMEKKIEGYNLKDSYVERRGKYKLNKMDRGTLGYVETLDYPIKSPEGDNIYPNNRNRQYNDGWRWRWSKEKLNWGLDNGFIEFKKNKEGKWQVYYKIYEYVNNKDEIVDKTNTFPYTNKIPENIGGTVEGTRAIKDIFGEVVFNYTKPLNLIKYLINLNVGESIKVLDFFAGSGTTGQAVMELNKEDGGNRSFILCTNNEVSEEKERSYLFEQGFIPKNNKTEFNKYKKNNPEEYQEFLNNEEYQELGIARSVTRERLKRVIEGYKTPKGVEVEGLPNNLMYLKTDEIYKDSFNFVDNIPLAVKDTLKLVYPSTTHKIHIIDILTDIDGLELGDNLENVFLIDSKDDKTTSMLNNKIIKKFGMDTKVELVSKYL